MIAVLIDKLLAAPVNVGGGGDLVVVEGLVEFVEPVVDVEFVVGDCVVVLAFPAPCGNVAFE
jgi:hypothetical protein